MILAGVIALGLAGLWAALALVECARLGLSFHQAVLYLPLKVIYRVRDDRVRVAHLAPPPVIYAVSHQSRLDPALMLCLLPKDTLHILDENSSRSPWLEPWRELARTIPFNAQHVFISRRLVRRLKGSGRLAVYLPDVAETDVKGFSVYRAVARIATKANARIVPVFIGGARHLPSSLRSAEEAPRRLFPKLEISVLEPLTMAELGERSRREPATASSALFDRILEARRLLPGNEEHKEAA
jgi:acyl-[acyl-carrier-protein]-phospholipid O-acyltransferase/long-chain-fatty-acid--[acyl-carrier-protein] ligase